MRWTLFAQGASVTCSRCDTLAAVFALVLSLLAAAPDESRRFVLEVAGIPVAELRVSVNGDRYLYESTHFLEEGPRTHRVQLRLKKSTPLPEVLALLHPPPPGCFEVLEERTAAREQLCVNSSDGQSAAGTIAGEKFSADYDEAGALNRITVGSAKWFAAATPTAAPPQSPFVKGVAVPAGPLRLDPPLEAARWLARAPEGVGAPDSVGRVRCLVLAREEAARRPGSHVAVGVVIEDRRAYPHAWVTGADGNAVDPSVLEGDSILESRRYLEVPAEQAGTFYLRLFDGVLKLKAK